MPKAILDLETKEWEKPSPERWVSRTAKGISEKVVEEISWLKNEPRWMLEKRLAAYKIFVNKSMPTWGVDLSELNFADLTFFIRPEDRKFKSWDDVPEDIKSVYNFLGLPQAEQKILAGFVGQYESEGFYAKLKEEWEKLGVIFTDTDTAVQKYPDLIKEYFMTRCVPIADHKFAALHGAVWSGGSFVYVPKGVKVTMPLQTYFRMNAPQSGQFEHTIIIAEEGSSVHYIESCFAAGTRISCNPSYKKIEEVAEGDRVLTHLGVYKPVYRTMERSYTGSLYTLKVYGDAALNLRVTQEHPFFAVRRELPNERNKKWIPNWISIKYLRKGDYLAFPINREVKELDFYTITVDFREKNSRTKKNIEVSIPSTEDFFHLVGFYLSEGSVDKRRFYLSFSFNIKESRYVKDVEALLCKLFGVTKVYKPIHEKNRGISVVVSSAKLARIFEVFGNSHERRIPDWMMFENPQKQKELIKTLYFGDGNYYLGQNKHGRKEMFRINTISSTLAYQVREILARLDIASGVNLERSSKKGVSDMYVVVIGGENVEKFGRLIGVSTKSRLNGKKRATMYYIDERYMYVPIREIKTTKVRNLSVFNLGVEDNESYVAGGMAVHNCTAPKYSTDSLHSAVVEIFVKPGASARYTTIQNWSKNVYNLNTKRALVYEDGKMEWVGGSLGSKATMLYPMSILLGKGASARHLNVAVAGPGQWKDTGAKIVHGAPYTSSRVISKSISMGGGRSSYRGLLKVAKGAHGSKSHVQCDAMLVDEISQSDTYPYVEVYEDDVSLMHEATVNRITDEQLFYLRSRGFNQDQALDLMLSGFLDPISRELPLDFALELNQLIRMEIAGSVG